ncbi:preprotein translocase subunit SecG [Reinekea thalattae]|uniref:Protein-export membrane protein SecG n=1 Tax=Reinekea thalattae TaxID=2593301 RepID=A0A5C8Z2T3_9GAMM|nr:preprotein translocase subunit SecG [Reinekea thalattae]TXR51857.1 preprotein translocase subunit SecG [Reinekea thalattae]
MLYENLVLLVHVLLAIGVIGFVLIQRGKGAEAGASFGGGASQTVFGSGGSGNFLTRMTAILVAGFFVTSLALAYVAKQKADALSDINIPATELPIESDTVTTEQPASALPAE